MNIKTFLDCMGKEVQVHVNMGDDMMIYLKHMPGKSCSLDTHIACIPLSALEDVLLFCQEYQNRGVIHTRHERKITKHGITFVCGRDMEVSAFYQPEGDFVHISNQFPDTDGTTYRSHISYLTVASLAEAVSFGKVCEREFHAMLERAQAKRAQMEEAQVPASSQNETLPF